MTEAEQAFRTIIEWIGEDPDREGLKGTPKRLIKAFKEYFQGLLPRRKKLFK